MFSSYGDVQRPKLFGQAGHLSPDLFGCGAPYQLAGGDCRFGGKGPHDVWGQLWGDGAEVAVGNLVNLHTTFLGVSDESANDFVTSPERNACPNKRFGQVCRAKGRVLNHLGQTLGLET